MKFYFPKSFLTGCSHGPQTWPWWRLVVPSVNSIGVQKPSTGWRLWLYTRWGALSFDVYFDRRPKTKP